jgi:sulfur-carrier protein
MNVRVKLFAVAAQIAGQQEVAVDVPDGANITAVRGALLETVPALRAVVSHARWAVDAEFVGDMQTVRSTSEVALIPPVSGG